jgi:tetratricopeptide (TPR) repeat protein
LLFNKALAIQREELGADHMEVGNTYNNIGGVFLMQGKFSECLAMCRKALTLMPGDDDEARKQNGALRRIHGNIGQALLLSENPVNFSEGVKKLSMSVKMTIDVYGEEHDKVRGECNEYGGLVMGAVEAIAEGENNPENAKLCSSAAIFFQQVIEIRRRVSSMGFLLGDAHYNKGLVLIRQGAPDEAAAEYGRAAEVYESCYGPGHEETVDAREQWRTALNSFATSNRS